MRKKHEFLTHFQTFLQIVLSATWPVGQVVCTLTFRCGFQMNRGISWQEASAVSCQARARPKQRLCGGDTGRRWPWSTQWPSRASGRSSSCSPTPRICPLCSQMGMWSRCPWCIRLQRLALVRCDVSLTLKGFRSHPLSYLPTLFPGADAFKS